MVRIIQSLAYWREKMEFSLTHAELIPKGFWETTGSAAKSVGSAIKTAVVWCGHAIKVLFTDYLIPGMKTIWPYVAGGMAATWNFLKTPIGLGTAGLIFFVGIGIGLFSYAHAVKKEESEAAILMLRIAGIASFVLGGIAFSFGIFGAKQCI